MSTADKWRLSNGVLNCGGGSGPGGCMASGNWRVVVRGSSRSGRQRQVQMLSDVRTCTFPCLAYRSHQHTFPGAAPISGMVLVTGSSVCLEWFSKTQLFWFCRKHCVPGALGLSVSVLVETLAHQRLSPQVFAGLCDQS